MSLVYPVLYHDCRINVALGNYSLSIIVDPIEPHLQRANDHPTRVRTLCMPSIRPSLPLLIHNGFQQRFHSENCRARGSDQQ